MFIIGDFIIAFDEASQVMVVYAQPELPPPTSYAPEVCAKMNSSALHFIPAEAGMKNRLSVAMMYWETYPTTGSLASTRSGFASIYETGGEMWLLERVEICLTNSASTFDPLPIKCQRSYFHRPYSIPFSMGSYGMTEVCLDEKFLLHSISNNWTQVVFYLSSSNENGESAELGKGILYDFSDAFEFGVHGYSLSPFAGRMCIVASGGIEVVDFVELPYLQSISVV
ncbi:hypothetical protein DL96DRAFT_118967 [Flagelloscypha sp. PMI_526]|nr:hypothetical protein DL96DRAFT_118967 [Flagelloscypha sp. PMI_526]